MNILCEGYQRIFYIKESSKEYFMWRMINEYFMWRMIKWIFYNEGWSTNILYWRITNEYFMWRGWSMNILCEEDDQWIFYIEESSKEYLY
jgi:hypothetical protein